MTDWKYSGEAEELVLRSPLYLGGLPPQSSPHPPQMWSATSSAGMVGCIRDLVMNGRSVQLAEVARAQDLGQYHSVRVDRINIFPSHFPEDREAERNLRI